MTTPPDIAHHAALDQRMVAAARGDTALPRLDDPRGDFSDARRELDAVISAAD